MYLYFSNTKQSVFIYSCHILKRSGNNSYKKMYFQLEHKYTRVTESE